MSAPLSDAAALQAALLHLLEAGPTTSERLAQITGVEPYRVRFCLAHLRRLDLVEFRIPMRRLVSAVHASWPPVDRLLHGLPPKPPKTTTRRPRRLNQGA